MKRIVMVGTMAFAITVSIVIWREDAAAAAPAAGLPDVSGAYTYECPLPSAEANSETDSFVNALGASSEEDIYDALYDGQSLADIAGARGADVRDVIELQVAELTAQLDARMAAGNLAPDRYEAHKAELREVVTRSAYGSG